MQKLVELFEYIISGDALVLYGAGLSADAGLPAWKDLLSSVFDSLGEAEKASASGRAVYEAIAQGLYPRAFDFLARIRTDEWAMSEVERCLKKHDVPGEMYKILATLPFKGYLTTNYDDIFTAELQRTMAVSEHLNSQRDIQQVDFDTVSSIVKIHGDFSDPNNLILGERKYNEVLTGAHYEYLRVFIQSQVLARRLVLIGYSLADPDTSLILEEAQRKIRRNTPIYALIPNADSAKIKEWSLKYNINIISYPDNDGKHGGLLRLLEILQQYNSVDPKEIAAVTEDMQHVQHLYMWHKFSFNSEEESTQGAVDSIVMGLIGDAGESQTFEKILSMLSCYLPHLENLKEVLNESVKRLENTHAFLTKKTGAVLALTPSGSSEYTRSCGKYERLCTVFKSQLVIEVKREMSLSSDDAARLGDIALRALLSIFKERAVEIFKETFCEEFCGLPPTVGMLRILSSKADAAPSFEQRSFLMKYCSNVFQRPRKHEKELLSYLARAFFCFQSLQMDREGLESRVGFLSNRYMLADSNILIPCFCSNLKGLGFYKDVFENMKKMGVHLNVLPETIDEIRRSAKWAVEIVKEFGDGSREVFEAVKGSAEHHPNQFLQAYVQHKLKKPKVNIRSYVESIFGGSMDIASIKRFLEEHFGVITKAASELISFDDEVLGFRDNVRTELRRLSLFSPHEKSDARINHEAMVYTLVALWKKKKLDSIEYEGCRFVSLGTALDRLAHKKGVMGVPFSPIVSIEGLVEIVRLINPSGIKMDFSEWLDQSYFPSLAASSLISDKAARKYFSPIIDNAEREYMEHLDEFRLYLDDCLSKKELSEIDPLDRPELVESMFIRLESVMDKKNDDINQLSEKLKKAETEKKSQGRKIKYWRKQARRLSKRK